MKWLHHDEGLFAAEGFLVVGLPCVEDIPSIWEQITIVISLGTFQNLEELVGYLRCGRDAFVCGTSKDEKDVLAFFDQHLVLFIAVATAGLHLGEHSFIVGLSATVENADDVAVVFLAHSTESRLEIVQGDLF